jgi:hypothetical protein
MDCPALLISYFAPLSRALFIGSAIISKFILKLRNLRSGYDLAAPAAALIEELNSDFLIIRLRRQEYRGAEHDTADEAETKRSCGRRRNIDFVRIGTVGNPPIGVDLAWIGEAHLDLPVSRIAGVVIATRKERATTQKDREQNYDNPHDVGIQRS